MKRIIIAILSLIFTCILCIIGLFALENICDDMTKQLKNLSQAAQSENPEDAVSIAYNVVNAWDSAHKKIEVFIPHEKTDELEEIINSLPIYAKQGNMERLTECAETAIIRLEHIVQSEKPSINNIF